MKRTKAVDILHQRYIGDRTERKISLEIERANAEVAQAIYDLRKEAGLTQKELADLIGTTQSVISRLEDADYEGHSLAMLNRISNALKYRISIKITTIYEGLFLYLKDNVSFSKTSNQGILIDNDNKNFYNTNESASIILKYISRKDGVLYDFLRIILLNKYKIDFKKATISLNKFLDDLIKSDLIKVEGRTFPLRETDLDNIVQEWITPEVSSAEQVRYDI
jgi:transcriptional regulator with XRE-family HTH domain